MIRLPQMLKQRFSQRPDSEHGQALVRLAVLTVVLVYLLLHGPGDGGVAFGPLGHIAQFVLRAELDVTAQLDIRPAPGHIGGDGDRPQPSRLRHDMRLAFMEAGVQHRMLDPFLIEEARQQFRLFDRDRADQHRLPL